MSYILFLKVEKSHHLLGNLNKPLFLSYVSDITHQDIKLNQLKIDSDDL